MQSDQALPVIQGEHKIIMDSVNVSTPYDDVFKTLLNDCTEFVIPLVNEVFGEDYVGNEPIQFLQNEHFMTSRMQLQKRK